MQKNEQQGTDGTFIMVLVLFIMRILEMLIVVLCCVSGVREVWHHGVTEMALLWFLMMICMLRR